jgi:hypothetical protein
MTTTSIPTAKMLRRLHSALPQETIGMILSYDTLQNEDLYRVLLVNSVFYTPAAHQLYRVISPDLTPWRIISLLKTLARSDGPCLIVRELNLNWSQFHVLGALLRLLNKVLRRLCNLKVLTLDLSGLQNQHELSWVFAGTAAKLSTFSTSICASATLTAFLSAQDTMEELCLRSFHAEYAFTLPADALPRLKAFRAVHGGAEVFAEVLRGRPVEHVTLSLYTDDGLETLQALQLSTKPIRRLTVMSLDRTNPKELLDQIAQTNSQLEALHIVILFGRFLGVRLSLSFA